MNLKIIGHGSGHGSLKNSPPIYIYIYIQIPSRFFCQDFIPTPTLVMTMIILSMWSFENGRGIRRYS
jgi:hypothetical protein